MTTSCTIVNKLGTSAVSVPSNANTTPQPAPSSSIPETGSSDRDSGSCLLGKLGGILPDSLCKKPTEAPTRSPTEKRDEPSASSSGGLTVSSFSNPRRTQDVQNVVGGSSAALLLGEKPDPFDVSVEKKILVFVYAVVLPWLSITVIGVSSLLQRRDEHNTCHRPDAWLVVSASAAGNNIIFSALLARYVMQREVTPVSFLFSLYLHVYIVFCGFLWMWVRVDPLESIYASHPVAHCMMTTNDILLMKLPMWGIVLSPIVPFLLAMMKLRKCKVRKEKKCAVSPPLFSGMEHTEIGVQVVEFEMSNKGSDEETPSLSDTEIQGGTGGTICFDKHLEISIEATKARIEQLAEAYNRHNKHTLPAQLPECSYPPAPDDIITASLVEAPADRSGGYYSTDDESSLQSGTL